MKTPPVRTGLPRTVEAVIAMLCLALAFPLLAIAALLVYLDSSEPVLFRQRRIGRFGNEFVLFKLRTMRICSGGPSVTAGDDQRTTWIGRILRKSKLDELPELWNVVKGDMSLVGPRPELPQLVNLSDPTWQLVLNARPGLTDPVTLRLRNEEALLTDVHGDREVFYMEILQPFKLSGYLEYLRRRSWQSDVLVLWQTAVAIVLPGTVATPTQTELLSRLAPHS